MALVTWGEGRWGVVTAIDGLGLGSAAGGGSYDFLGGSTGTSCALDFLIRESSVTGEDISIISVPLPRLRPVSIVWSASVCPYEANLGALCALPCLSSAFEGNVAGRGGSDGVISMGCSGFPREKSRVISDWSFGRSSQVKQKTLCTRAFTQRFLSLDISTTRVNRVKYRQQSRIRSSFSCCFRSTTSNTFCPRRAVSPRRSSS